MCKYIYILYNLYIYIYIRVLSFSTNSDSATFSRGTHLCLVERLEASSVETVHSQAQKLIFPRARDCICPAFTGLSFGNAFFLAGLPS